jgi:protein-S-isoprenylcysteine O-methyltransferase Ste14
VIRTSIFLVFSAANLAYSWPWLCTVRSYGFYRFLAFEGLCGLLLVQMPAWFADPLSAHQLLSWICLAGSLALAMHGFVLLHHTGKPERGIEPTTILVTRGAYRYIRHPLYCSLLLLAGGAFIKSVSAVSFLLALASTGLVALTAFAEEQENLVRFGSAYASYRTRTKMFVPWVF